MARELGTIQPQSSTRRIIINQSSSNSSSSGLSAKMRTRLLDDRATAILYTVIAALNYVTAGTMVGWSNGAFRLSPTQLQLTDNWSISLAATPALVMAVTAIVVHRCYHWIGTKAFLLTAALLAVGSSDLEALGPSFWCTSAARILAGISAGIAFTLVPSYVDEFGLGGRPYKPLLDDLLATAFPLGVLLRFSADCLLPVGPSHWVALCWSILPACTFLATLLLPESARYLCATGRVPQAAAALQRTHPLDPATLQQDGAVQSALSRWQQPTPGLLEAARTQRNLTLLVPLLALFAFQAFVGVLPMLFYLTDLLVLAGHDRAPDQAATLLAAVFTVAVPLARKLLRYRGHRRPLLVGCALTMAGTVFALGWHCHERRTHSAAPTDPGDWPLAAFALFFAAYAVGFHRLPGVLLESEARDENLFALRTLAVALCWGSVYLAVRLLPVLLGRIGLGWVLWNAGLVALFAALLVLLGVPRSGDFAHKTLPTASRPHSFSSTSSSSSSSSSASGTPTPPHSACWPCAGSPPVATPPTTTVQIFNYTPSSLPAKVDNATANPPPVFPPV